MDDCYHDYRGNRIEIEADKYLNHPTKMYDPVNQPIGSKYDPVNHPQHYTSHPSGIECITITRHYNFNLGNVIKYIWRCYLKGKHLEDLKKARFYLDDEIKRLENELPAAP